MRRNGNYEIVGEIIGLKPQRLAVDPDLSDLRQALTWFNTTEKKLRYFDGTDVRTLAVGDNLDDYLQLAGGEMTGPLTLAADAVEDLEAVTLQQHNAGLSTKQDTVTGAASTVVADDLTSDRIVVTTAEGKIAVIEVAATKLNHLINVESDIQGLLDDKQDTIGYVPVNAAGDTLTGNLNFGSEHTATGLRKPTEPTDAVRLIDLDNLKADLDFQADVQHVQRDGSLVDEGWPVVAGAPIRVIVTNLASLDASFGVIEGLAENDIIVKTAEGYVVAYAVSEHGAGVLTWATDLGKWLKYDGTEWNEHGGLSGVTAASGLGKEDNTIFVRYGAGTKASASGKIAVSLKTEGCLQTEFDGELSEADEAQVALQHNTQFKVVNKQLALAADSITVTELAASAIGHGLVGGSGDTVKVKAADTSIVVTEDGVKLGDVSESYLKFDVGGTLTEPLKVIAPTEDANPATKKYTDDGLTAVIEKLNAQTTRFEQSQFILDARQGTAETAYAVEHNFGNIGVIVAVYGDDMLQLIPDGIELVNENRVDVTLANPQNVLIVVQGLKAITPPIE